MKKLLNLRHLFLFLSSWLTTSFLPISPWHHLPLLLSPGQCYPSNHLHLLSLPQPALGVSWFFVFFVFFYSSLSSAEVDLSRGSSSSLYLSLCPAVTLSLNQPSSYRRPQRRKKQWSITLPRLPESLSSVISGVDVWVVKQYNLVQIHHTADLLLQIKLIYFQLWNGFI